MRFPRTAVFFAALFAMVPVLLTPTRALGQFVVDCSGNTPGAYPNINSVVPYLNDWSTVQVSGTCQGTVWLHGLNNVWIGAAPGQSANIQGILAVNSSHNMTFQNLNITNPNGTGIAITNGSSAQLNNCTSNNNGGTGLYVGDSLVTVPNGGSFNNNSNSGISVNGASALYLGSWFGPGAITVNNNVGDGIYLEDGIMLADGGLTISGNHPGPGYNAIHSQGAGYGINVWGHGRGFLLASWADDTITGNQLGGLAVHESSEFVLGGIPANPSVPTAVVVDGNGPVGVSVGFNSQVSLWSGVQITNHTDAGVDVYANSQVIIDSAETQGGTFSIANNGGSSASNPQATAGVRVDGNSEAYVRGGQISQNSGPGILVLANSSVDLLGTALASNAGGSIVCDSSAWLIADKATVTSARPCRTPNEVGPIHRAFRSPSLDVDQIKAQAMQQGKF